MKLFHGKKLLLFFCGLGVLLLFAGCEKTEKELEKIKTATNKDADIKYSARLLLHLFEKHPECYDVVIHKLDYEDSIKKYGLALVPFVWVYILCKLVGKARFFRDARAVSVLYFMNSAARLTLAIISVYHALSSSMP